jgi:hypothetical protein
MSLILDGTNGLSDVDGSAATPAIRGSDANTGIFFDADIIGFSEGGTECARFNADAQFVAAAGTALLPVITTTGDVNTGIFFPAADTIAFAEGGAEAMRIDSSGNLLVGTTTAGTMSGGSVIGVGARGGIIANSADSIANNGTLDIAINTPGGGYQGFLLVANTNMLNAAARTQTTFSVFGRGTDSSIQQIATDNGATAGAAFTVTTPSNGVIRVTNTSGSTTEVTIQFFGGTSR